MLLSLPPTASSPARPAVANATRATPVADSQSGDTLKYQVFCAAWAISVLFHMAQSRLFTTELHYALLTLAAAALLLKPGSIPRLAILIALHFYEGAVRLPYVPNHWIVAVVVNLTILQAFFYLAIKKRSLSVDRAKLLRTFEPVVRLQVILLYYLVVLHKLNWGFLDADASCGAILYKAQHLEGLLPAATAFPVYNIYLTLFIEALIPTLFIFRRTRNAGLLVALGFHCLIAFNSLNGFYDFSGMIFAAYILFMGASFSSTVYAFYRGLATKRTRLREQLSQFSFKNLAVLSALFVGSLAAIGLLTFQSRDYFRLVWAAYSFVFILLFILSLKSKRWPNSPTPVRFPTAAFLFFPALVVFNGLCPYLGLKTESSFAMFSNLRTEGGVTNHLFIPVSTQVFDYQQDLVEIISSSDPQLQKIANDHHLLPFFHFRNHVAAARPARIEYLRNGQQHTFTLASAAPTDELLQRSSILMRKLMGFRPVSKTEPQPCQH